ncbi:MAG: DNA topoisomerase III, partial [Candidatus Frackibacter sp. T328-2]
MNYQDIFKIRSGLIKSLVLAEKPSVGRDYAKALGCNNKKDGYIEGKDYIISWTFGHLFSLKEPEDYNKDHKNWKYEHLPIIPDPFQIKLKNSVKKQFKIIKKLTDRNDIGEIINGGDAGREGELIQRYVIESTGTKKPVKRLWISSFTNEEIKKGFKNLKPASDYDNIYYAADLRNKLDWLIGMNYSRAYTLRNRGNKAVIVGRVQTAILSLITQREQENEEFNPVPYKEIEVEFENYTGKYINDDNYRIFDFDLVKKIVGDCKNNKGQIKSIEKNIKETFAPKLFNLTGLQKVMSKKYSLSAQQTHDIAQTLYEKKQILTYPRTSSRHLGETHKKEIPTIIKAIKFGQFEKMIDKIKEIKYSSRFINDSKTSDHHALIPTKNNKIAEIYKDLSKNEKLLYDEVLKRFIAQFLEPYQYESTVVNTAVDDKYIFESKGKVVINDGWKEIYPDKNTDDNNLPKDLEKGIIKDITNIETIDKQTSPPSLYSEDTLLSQLEKLSIGTDATRAGILEKLFKRKYIERKGKKMISTKVGKEVIEVIETDKIKDPKLTGRLEKKLESVKKGKVSAKKVLSDEIDYLKAEIEKLKNKDFNISKDKNIVCDCPQCSSGKIIKRKSFYSCSNWNNEDEKCNFSISKIAGKMLTENQVK